MTGNILVSARAAENVGGWDADIATMGAWSDIVENPD
jgi:hypothetical protein